MASGDLITLVISPSYTICPRWLPSAWLEVTKKLYPNAAHRRIRAFALQLTVYFSLFGLRTSPGSTTATASSLATLHTRHSWLRGRKEEDEARYLLCLGGGVMTSCTFCFICFLSMNRFVVLPSWPVPITSLRCTPLPRHVCTVCPFFFSFLVVSKCILYESWCCLDPAVLRAFFFFLFALRLFPFYLYKLLKYVCFTCVLVNASDCFFPSNN